MALANIPDKANAPVKQLALSSNTSLAISWTGNTDNDLPGGMVTGYKIFIDNGLNGDINQIYYG